MVAPMANPPKTVDPEEIGCDAERLGRLDSHLRGYLDRGQLAGFALLVARGGEVGHFTMAGLRDLERSLPIEADTVYRIYSMTKPVTSVAAMMLYEEGRFDLNDPIASYLPEFAEPKVFAGGSSVTPILRPAAEPIRIWHLLTHTSGMTYGFMYNHPVDAMYRSAGFEWGTPKDVDLAGACEEWARLPLLFEPGSSWNYSHATDVVGRLVEVLSGQSLDAFLKDRILGPLGMDDTGFWATPDQVDRLATLYLPDAVTGKAVPSERMSSLITRPPRVLSGGGGLVSTIGDYYRFTQLLSNGGELDGVRLLGSRTLEYMTRNHLPGNQDMAHFGRPVSGEAEEGLGFGLGFSVVIDPSAMKVPASEGEFAWGGAASTIFWVDPIEDLLVIFMTQLLPSGTYPLRRELRRLVYQAIVD
jgi:CubicO group peptidase (beta-lactamase class C family)